MRCLRWLAAVLLVASPAVSAAGNLLDAILVRVDQTVVTWSQVLQEHVLGSWAAPGKGERDSWLVADELARRRLLVTEARKMRIEVSPEEIATEVQSLSSARGEVAPFWEELKRWGVTEDDVLRRCRDVLLVRRYLALRQEMTYVPESDVRAYHALQGELLGGRALSETREEIRSLLVRKKYAQELDEWVARQFDAGRVRSLAPPVGRLPFL